MYIIILFTAINFLILQPNLASPNTVYIFNHVQFLIWYHKGTANDGRIIKTSVALASCSEKSCENPMIVAVSDKGKLEIEYSYTVLFMVNIAYTCMSHVYVLKYLNCVKHVCT